jgi:hypothetical protein
MAVVLKRRISKLPLVSAPLLVAVGLLISVNAASWPGPDIVDWTVWIDNLRVMNESPDLTLRQMQIIRTIAQLQSFWPPPNDWGSASRRYRLQLEKSSRI